VVFNERLDRLGEIACDLVLRMLKANDHLPSVSIYHRGNAIERRRKIKLSAALRTGTVRIFVAGTAVYSQYVPSTE
jgi:hypothetical protein